MLNGFFAKVKQYAGKFRLIFIAGVMKVNHVSIFSTFNNLKDISLDEEFNSLLGFTKNDLHKYFDIYVRLAANTLNMSKDDVYKRIEQYYDGFQFAINANETVYNPWSIINFFDNPKKGFKNYWFKSSRYSYIIKYLKIDSSLSSFNKANSGILIAEDRLSDRYEITKIPRELLLFQTGYLTIRKQTDDVARLVFPNKEVEDSISKLCLHASNPEPSIRFSDEIQN
ncbi:MAG: AAA family ATPase [Desulfovibrionaceae bacterium]|nr:AAA family ATPase [Desulfovibrionaceae bacterium]